MTSARLSPTAVGGLAVTGLLLGLIGAVVQAGRTTFGTVTVPWGALLAGATVVVCVRAAVWSTGSRRAGAVVLAGWFLSTAAVLLLAPGGDVLLSDSGRARAYLLVTAFLSVLAASLPVPRGAAERPVPDAVAGPDDEREADEGASAASGEADGVR